MNVERMMNRLRSMSQGKLGRAPDTVATSNKPAEVPPPAPPTKEDILTTIDTFGDRIPEVNGMKAENNNVHVRRGSHNSVDSEGWMEIAMETEPTITSITHSYSVEWEKLFQKPNYLRHLRNYSIKGHLRSSRFRSIAWKLFLEVLPEKKDKWTVRCHTFRSKYDELKDKLIVNPRKAVDMVDLSVNNPLSQEDESPWNRFFLDNELRLTIKQDVIRTFPEIQFYHDECVRELMTNVLFCYCRDHVDLSYKQGMHELLAPIIFVLHCDHQAFLHASEVESLEEIVKEVMNPRYLEHDAYAMFSQIMQTVEPWYVSKEVYPTMSGDMSSSQPFSKPQDLNPSNVIVTKLTRIQDYLLRKADPELHTYLETNEIAPQIYGIRWIRLLFGREFPMQDILVLWDAIFADGIGFDLVDYVFVAMLLYIRDHLVSVDYPTCLQTLMRYPPVGDIHFFIEKARHIRDPHQFPCPPVYSYQSVQKADRPQQTEPKAHPVTNKGRHGTNPLHSITRKIYTSSSRPKSLTVSGHHKLSKSSSEPMNLQTEISPVSPTPGNVPQHKRASSASLSQVEDTMFRSVPSGGSLLHYETQSLRSDRSAVSTPDDISVASVGSPTKFSTLPNRKHKARRLTVAEQQSELKIASLQAELHDRESMCRYCASKLDVHIERLQGELLHQTLQGEDEILVAIAGIKQVRDVLKGTLKYSQNLLDDEGLNMADNHYKMEVTTSSPESEISPETASTLNQNTKHFTTESQKRRVFYMSSEENSEVLESPSEPTPSATGAVNPSSLKFTLREFELSDFKQNKGTSNSSRKNYLRNGGPDTVESELSKSWSPDSVEETDSSVDAELERESPNPLYRIRHGSYHL